MSKQHFANGVIGASLLDAFEQCQSRTRITNADDDEVYTSRPQITLALIRPRRRHSRGLFAFPTSDIHSSVRNHLGSCGKGESWDFAAVRTRHAERQLSSKADFQRSPGCHRGTTETKPIAASQLLEIEDRQADA
jgi:hypothetical protein